MPRLSLSQRRRIAQLYSQGLTIKEVAQELGLNPKTVSQYISQKRSLSETVRLVSMRRRADLARQVRLLYDSGYTVEEIVRLLGKNRKTIKRLLELTGIQHARRRAPLETVLRSRNYMRSAWELVVIEGRPIKEVAEKLGIDPETVRIYVKLYRRDLKRTFGEMPLKLLKACIYQEYYVKGRPAIEVARRFRVGINSVMEYAREYAKERSLQQST